MGGSPLVGRWGAGKAKKKYGRAQSGGKVGLRGFQRKAHTFSTHMKMACAIWNEGVNEHGWRVFRSVAEYIGDLPHLPG